jgi:hypothetical protein
MQIFRRTALRHTSSSVLHFQFISNQPCKSAYVRQRCSPLVTVQAARHAGNHQRSHQPGAVSNTNREVGYAPAVQIAQHAGVGDLLVGKHHEIHGGG